MKRWSWSWKQNAFCCIGLIREGDETSELFGKSVREKISPLYWRIPILLWGTVILTWSLNSFWGPIEKFLLYMTHWGLVLIIFEALFGIIVTVKKSNGCLPEGTKGLPWYVKTYWMLYNITIPVAFLVTVFYWGLLRTTTKKLRFAPNPILDIMLHGGNSVVMFVELISSAHPSKVTHIMQPLYFAGVYLLFSGIYFGAGGLDPWGNVFIYPVIDWTKPEKTMVVITLTALFLALMHLLVCGIAAIRDKVAQRWLRDPDEKYNDGFEA